MASDAIRLLVNGTEYRSWTGMHLSRSLDRNCSHVQLAVVEQSGADPRTLIAPFAPCIVMVGTDLALTGYVDEYEPEFDARNHVLRVTARSKVQDIVDCSFDPPSGQFRGYSLAAIARTVAAAFGIAVTVQTEDANTPLPDATYNRGETSYVFLERLARQVGVLITDDEHGSLLLTQASSNRASGSLIEGTNILRARARQSTRLRFSEYIIKSQRALGSTSASWAGARGIGTPSTASPTPVIVNQRATVTDGGVPRYRPHVVMNETQNDPVGLTQRAVWQRNYNFGKSNEVTIRVAGWRQPDGRLWRTNELITVTSPTLHIDSDLLIGEVTLTVDDREGRVTDLRLGPPEGFTPNPKPIRRRCKRGRKGKSSPNWDGAGIS